MVLNDIDIHNNNKELYNLNTKTRENVPENYDCTFPLRSLSDEMGIKKSVFIPSDESVNNFRQLFLRVFSCIEK